MLLTLICSNAAFAEGNCPQGYFDVGGGNAGFSGCAPIYNSDLGSDISYSPSPPNPGPRWQFRWGAIAVDGKKGKFAGIDGLTTPSKAKNAAVKQCRKNGGEQCAILIEYHNQCGALVWGDNQYAGFHGALLDEVTSRALQSCDELVPNCKIYYTGCSYPVEAD